MKPMERPNVQPSPGSRRGRLHFILPILLAGLALAGCQSSAYYGQAIIGHVNIFRNQRPIDEVAGTPETPERLKKKLELVMRIREFADASLQLPVGGAYRNYVELGRPYVVWNVYATPEFSLAPKTWRYPFIGAAAYRGYFSEADARKFAKSLEAEGYDVYVGGVTAYSTLGWFDDPVLDTFVYLADRRLAALIFHELAHRVLYVDDDTTFNESFAVAVEQEGLKRWLADRNRNSEYSRHIEEHRRRERFMKLLTNCRRRLEILYKKELPPSEKRREKRRILESLKSEYADLKEEWDGWAGWDSWFDHPVNNARLASVAMYYKYVPGFARLLRENDGELDRFFEACERLSKKSVEERRRILTTPDGM